MVDKLKRIEKVADRKAPVVMMILDGVGFGKVERADAVKSALTPTFDWMLENCPNTKLKAHGTAVGLPSDADMGNSEVGHNAIGCGRVFAQGAKLVNNSIETGLMYEGQAWKEIVGNVVEKGSKLHFIGLCSDGNVHSHINHLKAMIKQAKADGVKTIRVHALIDGRDVPPTSGMTYISDLEAFLAEQSTDGCDCRIASGGGRQSITMDRYNANWPMVERGWNVHVKGEGEQFASASEAYTALRESTGKIDQDLPGFVIAENGEPVGKIVDGDSVVNFNFRGDRAIEISVAFTAEECTDFNRGPRPDVCYAGMMQYDGDMKLPERFLVQPPAIDRTMSEFMATTGLKTLAISETQKYGHVTYFFNGNRSGRFDEALEEWVEIPSDVVPFEERPWMKCAEITDHVIEAMKSGKYDFIRLNYPNGDMVGHTGNWEAVLTSMMALDLQLARVKQAADEIGATLVISADHGNADDMFEVDKKTGEVVMQDGKGKPKTSHSLNPVPCIVYDPKNTVDFKITDKEGLGISSLAATCFNLLGYEAPADYDASVVELG